MSLFMIAVIVSSVCLIFKQTATAEVLTNPISGAIYSCSSTYLPSTPCERAFDNQLNNFWEAFITSSNPQYALITLDSPMTVTSYQVYMLDSSTQFDYKYSFTDYSYLPASWTFQGSNDGSTYTTLSTVSKYNSDSSISTGYQSFTCSSTASYKYYRFFVTASWLSDNFEIPYPLALIELVLTGTVDSSTALPTTMPSPVPTVKTSIAPSVSASGIRPWLKKLFGEVIDKVTGISFGVKEVSLSSKEYSSVTLTDVNSPSTTGQFDIDLYKGTGDYKGIIKITALTACSIHFKLDLKSFNYGVPFAGVGAILADSTATPIVSSSIIKSDDTTLLIEFSGTFAVGQFVAFDFNLAPTSITHSILKTALRSGSAYNKVVTLGNEFSFNDDGAQLVNYAISFVDNSITITILQDSSFEKVQFSAVDHALKITSYALSQTKTTSAQKNQITLTNSNGILTIDNFAPVKVGEKIVIDFTL